MEGLLMTVSVTCGRNVAITVFDADNVTVHWLLDTVSQP